MSSRDVLKLDSQDYLNYLSGCEKRGGFSETVLTCTLIVPHEVKLKPTTQEKTAEQTTSQGNFLSSLVCSRLYTSRILKWPILGKNDFYLSVFMNDANRLMHANQCTGAIAHEKA